MSHQEAKLFEKKTQKLSCINFLKGPETLVPSMAIQRHARTTSIAASP